MKKIVFGIIIVMFLALYGIAENHQRVQRQWGEWKEQTLDGAHPEKPGFCLYCYIKDKFSDYNKDKYGAELEKRDQKIEELEDSIRLMRAKIAVYDEAVKWLRNADSDELQRGIEEIRNIPKDVPLP